jgi:ATP-grasp domain-containing protein
VLVLFCADPFEVTVPDEPYTAEAAAAAAAGLEVGLIDYEALVAGDARRAARKVRESGEALYRGWMLTPARYSELEQALAERGVRLLTSAEAYRRCHYLPDSYAAIEPWTARSIWLPQGEGLGLDRVLAALRPFAGAPLVLKDYVKSCKHAWEEACFIPDSADEAGVERVVKAFLEWQGEGLNEGLVFREFVELASIGTHPQSGMPLTKEFRAFIWRGQELAIYPYWEEASYEDTDLPREWLAEVAARVESPFFTLDFAERREGGWLVIELGDGQVAGLPPSAEASSFYAGLAS